MAWAARFCLPMFTSRSLNLDGAPDNTQAETARPTTSVRFSGINLCEFPTVCGGSSSATFDRDKNGTDFSLGAFLADNGESFANPSHRV
jgi:hypothetical protein